MAPPHKNPFTADQWWANHAYHMKMAKRWAIAAVVFAALVFIQVGLLLWRLG